MIFSMLLCRKGRFTECKRWDVSRAKLSILGEREGIGSQELRLATPHCTVRHFPGHVKPTTVDQDP